MRRISFQQIYFVLFVGIISLFLVVRSTPQAFAYGDYADDYGNYESYPADLTLKYPVPLCKKIEFEQEELGPIIKIRDFGFIQSPGDPNLPMKILNFIVPPDADMTNITVKLEGSKEVPLPGGDYDIAPAPPFILGESEEVWGEGKEIVDGLNVNIYQQDAFYPFNNIKVLEVGRMRDWKVVKVAYYPFRYNPVTKEVVQSLEGEIVLSYSLPSTGTKSLLTGSSASMDSIVKQVTQNFDQASGWYRPQQDTTVPTKSLIGGPEPGYFILTTKNIQNLSTKLAEFVAHKEARGFNVQVITEEAWDYATGNEAADKIRTFLQANYIIQNIQYVLLIGDPRAVGDLPMKVTDEGVSSDAYYADLTGNWDLNGNGIYGEETDFGVGGIDFFPEVAVGRIPCYYDLFPAEEGLYAIENLDSILHKMIAYENGEYFGDWMKTAILSMKPIHSSILSYNLGEAIKGRILDKEYNWKKVRIYDDFGLEPPPEYMPCNINNVLDAWQNFAGLHVWQTHGSWGFANHVIDTPSVEFLSDDHPTFIFSSSCYNALPDASFSIAFSLLKNGAIGIIAATNLAFFPTISGGDFFGADPASMAFRTSLEVINNDIPFGDAVNKVKLFTNIDLTAQKNYLTYVLYGDPSMRYHLPVSISGPNVVRQLGLDTILNYRLNQSGLVKICDVNKSQEMFSENQVIGNHDYIALPNLTPGENRFRVELVKENGVFEDVITLDASTLIKPADNERVKTPEVEFAWINNPHASEYKLLVGTAKGAADIYSGTFLNETSTIVNGMTQTGQVIYVRLMSKINDRWYTEDHEFLRVRQGAAVLISPESGTKLASPDVAFRFDPGTAPSVKIIIETAFDRRAIYSRILFAELPGWRSTCSGVDVQTINADVIVNFSDLPLDKGLIVKLISRPEGSEADVIHEYYFNNRQPHFTAKFEEPFMVFEGDLLTLSFKAEDPDGDPLTFSYTAISSAKPSGIDFVDNHDGTANLTWQPGFDAVNYSMVNYAIKYKLSIKVSDGELNDAQDITIYLKDFKKPTINSVSPNVAPLGASSIITIKGKDFHQYTGSPGYNPDADIDNNGVIDMEDLSLLQSHVALVPGSPNYDGNADINHDGLVDGADIAIWQQQYGNIQGDNYVLFADNQEAKIASWSDTEIVCELPFNAVTGDVVVFNKAGSSPPQSMTIAAPSSLIKPAQNLLSPDVEFAWSPNDSVREYKLLVGTSKGAGDIYSGSFSSDQTSVDVSGINGEGYIVYVRLMARINDEWYAEDYEFWRIETGPAKLVSPTPGSQLQSSNVIFSWSPGTADVIALEVGTRLWGRDLFVGRVDDKSSITVANVPTDRTVFARLISYYKGTPLGTLEYTFNNNKPLFLEKPGEVSVAEGELLQINFSAEDSDGDPLIFTMFEDFSIPQGISFLDHGDGTATFEWTPDYEQAGTYEIWLQVSDGELYDMQVIKINVTNVNQPPVFVTQLANKTVVLGQTVEFTIQASDVDNDRIYFGGSAIPIGAVYQDNGDGTALFRWTPTQTGSKYMVFTIYDNYHDYTQMNTKGITITVTAPRCGDFVKSAAEQCDGTDFGGKTCDDYGYYGSYGTLTCRSNCTIDSTGCAEPEPSYGEY